MPGGAKERTGEEILSCEREGDSSGEVPCVLLKFFVGTVVSREVVGAGVMHAGLVLEVFVKAMRGLEAVGAEVKSVF